jgi:hypothetical protein
MDQRFCLTPIVDLSTDRRWAHQGLPHRATLPWRHPEIVSCIRDRRLGDNGGVNTAASAADVWVDERLVVRDSPIDGRGLFVTHAVPAGTVVMRLAGRLVTSAELDALIASAEADPAAPYVDTITIDDDGHLVLPPDTTIHTSATPRAIRRSGTRARTNSRLSGTSAPERRRRSTTARSQAPHAS